MNQKQISSLTLEDLGSHVWQFVNNDETIVEPVPSVPVDSLDGRVVAVPVVLANGLRVPALVGNLDLARPHLIEHYLTLSLLLDGKWFTLARYHDIDAEKNGPRRLAALLGLPIDAIFPIRYDVREYVTRSSPVLAGTVPAIPSKPLSRSELIALAAQS
jgi:hypothetical protein